MYRDERAALRERAEALAREIAGRQQELDEIRRTIDGLQPRLRLRLARPCPVDWNAMEGDDRVRFCKLCERDVYHLSAMKHVEVQELMLTKQGKLCVRFFQRADGTVMTSDCPVGKRERRRRSMLMTAGAAGAAALLAAASAGFLRMESVDDLELPQPSRGLTMVVPPPPKLPPPPMAVRPVKYVIMDKAPEVRVGGAVVEGDLTAPRSGAGQDREEELEGRP